jgi:hypothetical protein
MNEALESLLGDSSRITMDQNAALAAKNPRMIRDLLDLVYLQKDKFSPRAARVIYFTSKGKWICENATSTLVSWLTYASNGLLIHRKPLPIRPTAWRSSTKSVFLYLT